MLEIIDNVLDTVIYAELVICIILLAWYLITGGGGNNDRE